MQTIVLIALLLLLTGCRPENKTVSSDITFNQPVRVAINGYNGNVMEPFLSRDGTTLLFNNLNGAPENTNLHWATKINDTVFLYKGEISGINTNDLEAVPSVDNAGNLYFVSTSNYANTLSTLYQCNFSGGEATNIHLVKGVSRLQGGWVNFDVEVSADGQSLYFVDAQFDQAGNPQTADLVLAKKTDTGFQRLLNSGLILKNINTDALEYAACISADNLVLYFTRIKFPVTAAALPEILVSTRKNAGVPFGIPSKIANITGFAEAPSISSDQRILYYHKKENDKFVLYMVRKQ